MDFSADLTTQYDLLGMPVVHTSASSGTSTPAQAIHKLPGIAFLGGEMIGIEHTLRYMQVSFPPVLKGDQFMIGGISYAVREAPQNLLDGAEAIVFLKVA